ncbi:Flavin-dependent oxidoreductase, luciferase family (includes alkanesulfonate monooxygenase SsuD and methylene tetrahydromethanopterin reductase) [Novosphingobium sp. CF614]|nr:Flavin-dependent oxidoreductase, luciferase family (includes alkanesulfonate monooxygenase SsuD and methylene tetrahydromethanopterin reductase) [Novosphingobium sp. CF614]
MAWPAAGRESNGDTIMSQFRTSLFFDMRAPSFGAPVRDIYAAALEMTEFADRIGMTKVGFMEHHGCDDGYLANPFLMGAAVAARTRRIRINLGAVVLPLHDPLKVAEDIAIVDQISRGRVEVIFGAGYVPSEFARFGVSLHDRAKLMDRGIETILRALSGEAFDGEGRDILVRPLPVQDPRDILLVGGGVKASAIRAARFDLGFAPANPKLFALYESEMRERGQVPRAMHGPGRPLCIHLAEDVEAGWAELLPHAVHVASSYAAWADETGMHKSPFHGLGTEEAMRAAGIFRVWTPDQMLEYAANLPPHATLGFMPLLGGLSPEAGWRCLRLLEQAMPRLRALQSQRG